ncbi:MAG: acetate--CoA ligase [Deltaproteobacteria bacterium]|nr:acetate--CoA ligase [Deltaproteobacteria bacterium]
MSKSIAPHGKHTRIPTLAEYDRLYRESIEDPRSFWGKQGERVTWFHPFHSVLDIDTEEVDFSWYQGGRLNVSFNCVDRHAAERPNKTAILWAGNEPGEYKHITYRELKHQVARLANVLKAKGVQKGDRVCIYLPMIPEAAYAMLACARIGAVHSVVFAGFSAESLRDRIIDAGCKVVITANEAPRGPKKVALKHIVDVAVDGLKVVESVLVARRTSTDVPMTVGRDTFLDEEMSRQRSTCPVEWMASEDPLFILYTSGSTGKPKGVLHTTAGYLIYTAMTHDLVFDLRPDDIHFCTADVGWVTGHSYIVYGPLCNGATSVMFESVPNYPDSGRIWSVVDDTKATILYTAPTALRALRRAGDDFVKKHSRKSLRLLGTVGEPIDPETWQWYHDVVGEQRCDIVDTWWQTETGGVLISPLAGVTPMKPGSATRPFFGVKPLLVDEAGAPIEWKQGTAIQGNLCLASAWPGQARTIWGDHRRFRETYFSKFPNLYFTGDGSTRDEDGDWWITGRVDDVLNVSGHRIGTAELESALAQNDAVAESAVVGYPHDLKGQGIYAYVVVKPEFKDQNADQIIGALKETVRHVIGPIATPDRITLVSGLPKTRSGKVMRRILRKVAHGQFTELGDITTLADPGVVEEIIAAAKKG